ncbi:MAG: TIGR03619 family F420-dependent LLM class oxidoreductase [Actinobacteria bacterium]|nr:TIGR03619 family F420-dependent LLM class oxidoreductase [Actinomycetota bacterium]
MKFGLFLMPLVAEVATFRETVERADQVAGIDSIWLAEPHLLAFERYESVFPYSEDGSMPDDYSAEGELDGLLGLAYTAALTERVRIGVGVCVVPQWKPVSIAKSVTTLDHLSGGRFDFGVGIGWLREEFRAVGASFEDRAARCAADLETMAALWSESEEAREALPAELAGGVQEPFPLQRPHPPIHFGGNSRPALRRVAERGQGWLPWELTPVAAREKIATLEELLAAQGRERGEIVVSVATEAPLERIDVDAYAEAGVDRLLSVVAPRRSAAEVDQLFDRLDTIVAAAAAT